MTTKRDLSWLDEIKIDDLLEGDTLLICEALGKDLLKKLWEELPGISLYLSTKPLVAAKKRYVHLHFNGRNVKELSLLLDVSERFVYGVIEEDTKTKKRVVKGA